MKKLELKHIAPYLPYSLKGCEYVFKESPKHTRIYQLNSVNTQENETFIWDEINGKSCRIDCKPILIPLVDLLNDEDTIQEIYNTSWIAGQHGFVRSKEVIAIISHEDGSNLNIWLNKPHCNMEWVNEILYKYHYDLKGLIEKGLAIDKNTLE